MRLARSCTLAAAVLLLLSGSALAQTPAEVNGYNCPVDCYEKPNCYCASSGNPGGLQTEKIPQFIVLTNDDAVTITTKPIILDITDNHYNPNGCGIPATWFVSVNYTDHHLIQELYMKNHEIATHTLNHVSNPGFEEIVAAKLWLNEVAHVPMNKIRGFRAPFLVHNPEMRAILAQNGFLFDSSIPEPFPTATSPSGSERLWPYTMDYGLPQRCDLGTGPCYVNESYPGLWEFPMWDVQDESGTVLTNMDPQGDLYEAYSREFDRNYYGNRAPLGIYVHAAWLADPSRAESLKRFINYALEHENVWFATMSQVIRWMKDPKPASKVSLGCKKPTDMWFPSGQFCKAITCVNGNWSDVTCSCTCAAQDLSNQPGFCVDMDGACTVPKMWDDATRVFYCPGAQPAAPVPEYSPSPQEDARNPQCGHPLMNFIGLGMSGTQDNSELYVQAIQAVDGLCNTCALADDPSGNYFTVMLPEATAVTGVYLVSGEDQEGLFAFVGNATTNNGMDNPICAQGFDIWGNDPSVVSCQAVGSVVTIASATNLTVCDIYVMTAESAPLEAVTIKASPKKKSPPPPKKSAEPKTSPEPKSGGGNKKQSRKAKL